MYISNQTAIPLKYVALSYWVTVSEKTLKLNKNEDIFYGSMAKSCIMGLNAR